MPGSTAASTRRADRRRSWSSRECSARWRASGWRPRRSILFASWDAEEFALTSSTEWGEEHQEWLRRNAVAYLNVDSAASGSTLSVTAVPALNQVLDEVARNGEGSRLSADARCGRAGPPDPRARRAADRHRRRPDRQPARRRIRLHGLPELPRRARRRHVIRRAVRRVSLDLRQPRLGGDDWRPRLPLSRRARAVLGPRRAQARRRRRRAARLRTVRAAHQ